MDTTDTCRDCQQQPAVHHNPDGRARCRSCQRQHVVLVRTILADQAAKGRAKRAAAKLAAKRCRWTVGPGGAWCSVHQHGTGDQAQRTV